MLFSRDSWGRAPLPLLPEGIRAAWDDHELPGWLASDLGLAPSSTFAALGKEVWKAAGMDAAPDRVTAFLTKRVNKFERELARVCPVPRNWPAGLDPSDVPWSNRTMNALHKSGLVNALPRLAELTVDDLIGQEGFGGRSLLDFSCTVEAILHIQDDEEAATFQMMAGAPEELSREDRIQESLLDLVDLPWLGQASRQDPRLTAAIPAAFRSETLLEQVEHVFDLTPLSIGIHRAIIEAANAVGAVFEEIKALPLEAALQDYFLSYRNWDEQRLRAFYPRFGWGPDAGATLQEVGDSLGVSRERARQLEKQLRDRRPPHQVFMPALDRAITCLVELAPSPVEVAAQTLVDDGITSGPFRPEGVIAAAELLQHEHGLSIVEDAGALFVVTEESHHLRVIRQVASRQARASGASTTGEVYAELEAIGASVTLEEVAEGLEALPKVCFVLQEWFLYTERPDTRVTAVARKMLSVTAPLSATAIRDGVHRELRFRKTRGSSGWPLILPPSLVVLEIMNRHAGFSVDEEGLIRPSQTLNYREVLSPSEQAMIATFRESPAGVLDRTTALAGAVERGLNPSTASITLTYSSVVKHLGVGLWCVCGAHVDPAAVEAVRRANALRPREKRTLGYTWTTEGKLALAYKIPAAFQSAVFLVPADIRRFMDGRDFPARTESGADVGRIRVYDTGLSGGWGTFLSRSGAEEGDVIIGEFDLIAGSAVLRLESDEIFDAIDFSG